MSNDLDAVLELNFDSIDQEALKRAAKTKQVRWNWTAAENERRFLAVVEELDGGEFLATCVGAPGVLAQEASVELALDTLREVLKVALDELALSHAFSDEAEDPISEDALVFALTL